MVQLVIMGGVDISMSRQLFPRGEGSREQGSCGVCMREDVLGRRSLTLVHCRNYLQGMQAERADCRGAGLVRVRTLKPRI